MSKLYSVLRQCYADGKLTFSEVTGLIGAATIINDIVQSPDSQEDIKIGRKYREQYGSLATDALIEMCDE